MKRVQNSRKHIDGVHGIPGNIIVQEEYTESDNDVLERIEKVLYRVFGILMGCVVVAQIIIHVFG